METITTQVELLRDRFKTRKIFDKTTRSNLTSNEIECIEYVIKKEREDAQYEINDEIIVVLEKGACHIKDNSYE